MVKILIISYNIRKLIFTKSGCFIIFLCERYEIPYKITTQADAVSLVSKIKWVFKQK